MNTVALVAIAKNEGRYLREWIAYHLLLGIDRVVVYDNDSSDDTQSILETCASDKVMYVRWPSIDRYSPQRTAYADAIQRLFSFQWIVFIDIDEFIVPFGFESLKHFISKIPDSAGAVAINWKTFGNSNLDLPEYDLVTTTFLHCGVEDWAHNCHFKAMARPSAISEMKIHHPNLHEGELMDSSFETFVMRLEGRTNCVKYAGIQLNHYQVKTFSEFQLRMSRGNANFPPRHPQHPRDTSKEKFDALNNNSHYDDKILPFTTELTSQMLVLWQED